MYKEWFQAVVPHLIAFEVTVVRWKPIPKPQRTKGRAICKRGGGDDFE